VSPGWRLSAGGMPVSPPPPKVELAVRPSPTTTTSRSPPSNAWIPVGIPITPLLGTPSSLIAGRWSSPGTRGMGRLRWTPTRPSDGYCGWLDPRECDEPHLGGRLHSLAIPSLPATEEGRQRAQNVVTREPSPPYDHLFATEAGVEGATGIHHGRQQL
jgi:hypothetical protein